MPVPAAGPPDPDLRAAFLGASYGTVGERFRLSELRPQAIRSPLFATGERWAVLTAWNPGAARLTAEQNEARQAALEQALAGEHWRGGLNGEGHWAEPSLIVSGLTVRQSLKLGRDFGQAAVLWGCGARAALVWCASGRTERRWVAGPAVP